MNLHNQFLKEIKNDDIDYVEMLEKYVKWLENKINTSDNSGDMKLPLYGKFKPELEKSLRKNDDPPLYGKFKPELEKSLRKNDDPLLKRWYMAGACRMLQLIKLGNIT
jgi:hypothetical protein